MKTCCLTEKMKRRLYPGSTHLPCLAQYDVQPHFLMNTHLIFQVITMEMKFYDTSKQF